MNSARVSLAVAVFAIATCATVAEQVASIGRAEDQVAQLERDWLAADAKGDTAALNSIVADDFIGSAFNGHMLDKQDLMPEAGTPGGFAGASLSDTSVRVFGETAVLIGFLNRGDAATPTRIRVNLVCQKRAAGWQIVAAEMTRM